MDLFCKMANPRQCVHCLFPRIKSCNHYLRPKGHIYMNCPDVNLRCIKCHLYHVVFRSTRNVFILLMFIFITVLHTLSISTVYMYTVRLLRVTLNINRSINQPFIVTDVTEDDIVLFYWHCPNMRSRFYAAVGFIVCLFILFINPHREREMQFHKRSTI